VKPTHHGILIAPAPPCGFGVYAAKPLVKGEHLGEYTGESRRYDLWCDEIKKRKVELRGSEESVPFIREELYAAWTGDGPGGHGVVMDAYRIGNAMRFINCSCSPNCTFKSFDISFQNHCRKEVIALRDIERWTQLSVDYGWYFDDVTMEDVRLQAAKAYSRDVPALQELRRLLPNAMAESTRELAMGPIAGESEAVRVLAEAAWEAKGPPGPLRQAPPSFLSRFADPIEVAAFFEGNESLQPAKTYREIPDAVWQLYEVVGAELTGIPCRCALEPSLNITNKCSGVIGRPSQTTLLGRDLEAEAAIENHKWNT